MSRAPRQEAKRVKVGDLILSPYYPRTWQAVTAVRHEQPYRVGGRSIMLDTARDRTWWNPDDLVPCKPGQPT